MTILTSEQPKPPSTRQRARTKPTDKELRAIQFLMDEWDFGGLVYAE
jgi:hypothetical protein